MDNNGYTKIITNNLGLVCVSRRDSTTSKCKLETIYILVHIASKTSKLKSNCVQCSLFILG